MCSCGRQCALPADAHRYNAGGVSSSLAKPHDSNRATTWAQDKGDVLVPVLPLAALINAIPARINITALHTDMQGFDYEAVASVGHAISRVPFIISEVYLGRESYSGVRNDLERDWKPWARAMGYKIETARTAWKDSSVAWEANVKFRRDGAS